MVPYKMTSQYKWPRENLNEYKFDVGWPNDVDPSEIVVPFTSWALENKYRLAQQARLIAIEERRERDRRSEFVWNFQNGLYR